MMQQDGEQPGQDPAEGAEGRPPPNPGSPRSSPAGNEDQTPGYDEGDDPSIDKTGGNQ